MAFGEMRRRFAPKGMQTQPAAADELLIITPADGRRKYRSAPILDEEPIYTPSLPTSVTSADAARYLWVVDEDDVPHALERCPWAMKLKASRLKHSNLTGGSSAYFGGEIWFVDSRTLIINFCSGRYGANSTADQPRIDATVQALVEDGYRVATTGADAENGYLSSRLLVAEPTYLDAMDG